jgi:hypothetical protein
LSTLSRPRPSSSRAHRPLSARSRSRRPNRGRVAKKQVEGRESHGAPLHLRKRGKLTLCPLSIPLTDCIACTHIYWCSPGRPVPGGDDKLMMKVQPATTPLYAIEPGCRPATTAS